MLFSVVVLLPVSGALLLVVVVVVLESVDFCVTSGDGAGAPGDAAAPGEGEVSSVVVVVVVVVSFVVPRHPTIIVPAMKANPTSAANKTILFEIFMGRAYQNSMILHGQLQRRRGGVRRSFLLWIHSDWRKPHVPDEGTCIAVQHKGQVNRTARRCVSMTMPATAVGHRHRQGGAKRIPQVTTQAGS